MKILLVPFVTDKNRGDQALIWESINLIKGLYDKPEIVLMRGDDESQFTQTSKLGYSSVRNILRHPGRNHHTNSHIRYTIIDKVLIGIRAICDLIQTICLLLPIRIINHLAIWSLPLELKQTYGVYKECDAVFVKGGGFIHSYGSVVEPYQMYFNLFPVLLGIALKKKVYILPNSIGPLNNRFAAKIADYTLNHCKYVSVRESKSLDFLSNRKQIKIPVYRHYDLGYYLKASDFDAFHYLEEKGIDMEKPKVVITLRPYRFPGNRNAEEVMQKYITSFTEFVIWLYRDGYQVVFFAHTIGPSAHETDSIAIKEVLRNLDEQHTKSVFIEDESLNCMDVMAIYSYFDALIGTRFHSVIFAQNSDVPSLAITYGGYKGDGIMADLGIGEFAIPMDRVDSHILKCSFQKLIEEKDSVSDRLKDFHSVSNRDRVEMIQEIKALF